MISQSIILIPTLYERENLEKLIPAIFALMPTVSVLIIDDNSRDGTQEMINLMQLHFKTLFFINRRKQFGYGRACLEGFKWVFHRPHNYIVTMDADFSHDFAVIPALLKKLENVDVAVGSRYVKNGGLTNWSLSRRILSRFANFYVKLILGFPVMDATSGFNAYRANALKALNLEEIKSDGYAFLVELKYKLYMAGHKIIEYPITFSERREGRSKMSPKIIWEAIKLPWKLKLNF